MPFSRKVKFRATEFLRNGKSLNERAIGSSNRLFEITSRHRGFEPQQSHLERHNVSFFLLTSPIACCSRCASAEQGTLVLQNHHKLSAR